MNDTLSISFIESSSFTIPIHSLIRKILLGCLLFSLAIFTILGNLLILYAIRTEKRLRTVSNLFILSLAFADLVVGIFVMPLSAANIITGQWPFSTVLCQMWLSVDYVASTASIFNLVLLSLDRYWAVVYPLRYLQNRSRKQATNFIVIVWFISSLWAPVVIFWSYIIPQHSDINKPTECDTSFRSNKLFKTIAALFNFYLPLLTMILISCRIMVAVRSRSRMEFGRRISSATQRQMKQERLALNQLEIQAENQRKLSVNEIVYLPKSRSAVIDTIDEHIQVSNRNDDEDDTESLSQLETNRSSLTAELNFCFPPMKPMRHLFPSLSSIKEHTERQIGRLSNKSSNTKNMKNSLSISNNMKNSDRQSNIRSISLNHIPRTSSISSLSDECPQKIFIYPVKSWEKNSISKDKITVQITSTSSSSSTSSPAHVANSTDISPNQYLSIPSSPSPIVQPNKINILTFFDYIINPSLSRSLQKELKAARQLGMLVGVFTFTWLPYFILFLVVAWCQQCVSDTIYTGSIWLGYLNSTLNPLIYPLCNLHFRRAFKKIIYFEHAKTKLPNLNSLRDLRR
ncbi:hypothetical protein I4U23_000465 [Adineta vaga]|nr:hypothetical protein I4U23_000465 [Adineta vaga]